VRHTVCVEWTQVPDERSGDYTQFGRFENQEGRGCSYNRVTKGGGGGESKSVSCFSCEVSSPVMKLPGPVNIVASQRTTPGPSRYCACSDRSTCGLGYRGL
jgi:hypothetical protein